MTKPSRSGSHGTLIQACRGRRITSGPTWLRVRKSAGAGEGFERLAEVVGTSPRQR
jgi:hypothetical protein